MALHFGVSSPGNNCVSGLVHPTADAVQTTRIIDTLSPQTCQASTPGHAVQD